MPRNKRSSPQEAERGRDWLSPEADRTRPWAYEELLFGPEEARVDSGWLSSLEAELAVDLAELRRMQGELHEQVVRIAELEGRIRALRELAPEARPERVDEASVDPEVRSLPSRLAAADPALERAYSLARSEGFRVDSPSGFVGIVEGVRFESRIDQPDLLEVRGGRFGRELILIPVEAVDEVSLDEGRLVVREQPRLPPDHLHELLERLRRRLSVHHASP